MLIKLISLYKARLCGNVTIMTALMMPVILGFSSFAIDYGVWLYQKRQLQTIADISAMGGVTAIKNGKTSSVTSYATADAALNSFTAGSGKTITVNYPPTSGTYQSNNNAVQVILTQQSQSYLSSFMLATPPNLTATAVGLDTNSNACVVTLGNTTGVTVSGTGALSSPSCGIYANSSSSPAVVTNGGGTITTTTVNAVGTISGGGITASQGTYPYSPTVSDPFANLAMPTAGACDYNNFSTNGVLAVTPGTYCGGFKLTSHAIVAMSPGTYIISGGSFDIGAQATLTGTGVTIVLTGSPGDYATVTVNGGATVTLSAPTSGTYQGILFFGDRSASGTNLKFNGGSTMTLDGIIYAAASDVNLGGNGTTAGSSCTQVVSSSLTVSGNSYLGGGCTSSQSVQVGTVSLAE